MSEEEKDVIFENGLKDQSENRKFKTLTKEEQQELNEQTEHKTGLLVRFIRIIRDNPDLIILSIIVVSFCLAGYWLAKIELGMTTEQIKFQIWDFVEFVGIIIMGAIALIGKLFVAQGSISKGLSKSALKDADSSGRTIIK